jgi:exodeoxyribonuclease VII large subunit
LNRAIGNLFARHTPGQGFWVRGDIQRLSVSRNGHCYFELVERDAYRQEPRAVASAMLWSKRRQEIDAALAAHGLALADDLSVRVRVRVSFYEATGKVQLDVLDIDPTFTAGDLAVARERVRRTLRADGLFDANRRLAVPMVPLRISLVTSGGSAAYHDFVEELSASRFAFVVELFDTKVSGPGAAGVLASTIRRAGRAADVIVVVRGGGARSELTTFDAEPVARAVAGAPVPVWVGVGHEIDRSICDEVANQCFKTPTATAQALVAAVADFDRSLDQLRNRLREGTRRRGAAADADLERQHQRLRRGTTAVLSRLTLGLERDAAAIAAAPGRHLRAEDARLDVFSAQIRALDPARVLARGYSITRSADGRVLRDAARLSLGERVGTQLATGAFAAVVDTVTPAGGDRD